MKAMRKPRRRAFVVILIVLISAVITPTVLADTNGTELQVTAQPDKLVLELGSDWAGVEFELTTDAGVFPVPVVVNELGVLSMELGGSKTYTLSRISTAPSTEDQEPDEIGKPEDTPSPDTTQPSGSNDGGSGIPITHLVVFLVGLAIAGGGLIAMYVYKRRSMYYDDDDDEYGEDE